MQIVPKTEKEIAEMGLWPADSICSFEVISHVTFGDRTIQTSDGVSKKGNEMITLVLSVFNDVGESKILIDYLLESTAAKLRNAMIACGLLAEYEAGQFFASDFVGKRGELRIGIEKDKSGQYPDKNKVAGYIAGKKPSNDMHPFDPMNDKVPF